MTEARQHPWIWLAAFLVLTAGFSWWWHQNTQPAPSRVLYEHPALLSGFASCIKVDCRALAARMEVRSVRPGETLYRYAEYCLDERRTGRVVVRYSQPSYVPPSSWGYNAAEAGCHKRFFPVQVPDALLRDEPLTIQLAIEYERENLQTQVVELKPFVVKVSQ